MIEILQNLEKYKYFSENDNFILFYGDSIELLKEIPENSIDMIFADPPYFLSNGGITCNSGKMVLVDKGGWDKSNGVMESHRFNLNWLGVC